MITPEYCQNYLNRVCKKYRLGIKPLLLFYRYKKYSALGSADSNNEIRINLQHLNSHTLGEVRDTLRHELAHLKSFQEGGSGHNESFKKWAKKLKVKEFGFKY